jgi:hypothetical protein
LIDVWQRHHPDVPMLIEKDFSPTLAGDDRAAQAEMIIEWLTRVTSLIRNGAAPATVKIGLKVFNAISTMRFNSRCCVQSTRSVPGTAS